MNYLQFLINSIRMTFRVWQDGDGAGGDGGEATAVDGGEGGDGKELPPVEDYLGSEEVNPEQRLLRDFPREGLTHKEIDNLITHSDGELFLTDEEIKAKKAEKKGEEEKEVDEKEEDGKDVDKKEDDTGKSDKEKGSDKKDDDDDSGLTKEEKAEIEKKEKEDIEHFFKETELTQEKFDELPENVQDRLFASVFPPEDKEGKEESDKLSKEHQELKDQMAAMTGDHVIAARLKEKATNEKIVANADDILTQKVIDKVDKLLGQEKFDEATKLLKDEVAKAVKTERAVQDQILQNERDSQSVWKKLRGLGELDKRLLINEKSYKKFNELGEKHKEWNEFTKKDGMQDLIKFLVEKGLEFPQLKKMDKEEIYALYSKNRGWDKEVSKKIFKSGAKSVLEKLKNPKVAGTLKNQGKKPIVPGSKKISTGIDAETLTRGLADNDPDAMEQFENLLETYDGNKKMIDQLVAIRGSAMDLQEAERKAK